ncbi:MAG: M20/M25/M40 family metallo-hydrolase [Promethearchaeota archaeon]
MRHIDLLRNLIAFDTVNNPAQGKQPTRECPEYLKKHLEKVGFSTEIIEQKGYYSVLGLRGRGRPVTLFIAHFDVVPIGPGWNTDPFDLTIKEGKGYGRGAADDKGNVVALLLLAETLSKKSFPGTVALAMTGDEETGGNNGASIVRSRLEEQNRFPDYLITADGLGMKIITRRRNTCGVTITVPENITKVQGTLQKHRFTTEFFGRESRHSAYFLPGIDRHAFLAASSFLNHNPHLHIESLAGNFVKGNVVPDCVELNCIDPSQRTLRDSKVVCDGNLVRLIRSLLPISRMQIAALPSDYGVTFCPNLFRGTDEKWTVLFDGRVMTKDVEAVETALDTILAEKLSGIKYQATVSMGKAFMNSPITSLLVKTAQSIAQSFKLNPQPVELGGASDTRHFTDRAVEAIDFGPIGDNIHGSNEFVILNSIPLTSKFYIELVLKIHEKMSE